MSSKDEDTTIRKTARKKAVRQVPSRYMQASQASKGSSSGSASVNTTTSLCSNETLDVSQAPWTQRNDNTGNRFASTPNSADDSLTVPLHDVSEIATLSTARNAPRCKEQLIAASALKQKPKFHSEQHKVKRAPAVPVVPVCKPGKEKIVGMKTGPDRVQEIEIKNFYAMHVQAAFLESRARKSLQMRNQNALEQFYKVCCVIQMFIQKLSHAESNLIFVCHIQLVQQILKEQEEILEVVSRDMPSLLEYYGEISEAIDCVRSNLPLSDVHIAGDSNLRADLAYLLTKHETQLETFKSHSSKLVESGKLSNLLLEIKNSVEDLERETCRLNDLHIALDEMAITESSLKIAEMCSADNSV